MPRASRRPFASAVEDGQGLLEALGQGAVDEPVEEGGRSGWDVRQAAYRLSHAWCAALPRFFTSRAWASTVLPARPRRTSRVEAEELLGGGDLGVAEG
jgi:hypothetical protein